VGAASEGHGWRVYLDPADFPPFLCADCLGSNTWTDPVTVMAKGQPVGYVEGRRGCTDCWERRLTVPS